MVLGDAPMDRHSTAMRLSSVVLPIIVLALATGSTWAGDADSSGAKLDGRALARQIDEAIDTRIRSEQVSFSPPCDDAEFLRRVYLDITGRIPSAEKAAAFLDSRA